MTLTEGLALGEKDVISLVGGGGKTTLLFALGRELAARGSGIVLTTTTKIWEPAPDPSFAQFLSARLSEVRNWVAANAGRFPFLLVAAGRLENGKLQGVPPAWVAELRGMEEVAALVIEADGAAGRPLKAPREGEPVVPESTSLLVPVLGIDGLGSPLDEEHVFRSAIACRLLDLPRGSQVTEEAVLGLLAATLRNVPAEARVIPFINKVDLPQGRERARKLARVLLAAALPGVERIVLGQAARTPPVAEVVVRENA
jgi:probable selenium-dependent hydroxylase accessory protein YqeC